MTTLRTRLAEVLEGDAEPGHFLKDPALARALEDAERYTLITALPGQFSSWTKRDGQIGVHFQGVGYFYGPTIHAAIAKATGHE